jgi:hypothetical protein
MSDWDCMKFRRFANHSGHIPQKFESCHKSRLIQGNTNEYSGPSVAVLIAEVAVRSRQVITMDESIGLKELSPEQRRISRSEVS